MGSSCQAAFGYMADEIRSGYQAAVVSLESPTYRRLWLSAAHHPGDTVSCTQAEALVMAAKARTGLRPRRQTDLLRQRIATFERQTETTQQRQLTQQDNVAQALDRLAEARQQMSRRQAILANPEADYPPVSTGRTPQQPSRPGPQAVEHC